MKLLIRKFLGDLFQTWLCLQLVTFKLKKKKQSNRSWLKFRIHGNIGDRNKGNFLAIIRDFGVGLILAM